MILTLEHKIAAMIIGINLITGLILAIIIIPFLGRKSFYKIFNLILDAYELSISNRDGWRNK